MNSKNPDSLTVKDHLLLFSFSITAWFLFWVFGLPSDYFQKWNLAEQMLLTLITVFAVVPSISACLCVLIDKNYFRTGIWLAFYASIPLATLDFIIGGGSLDMFASHWYLTAAYFYVWLLGPLTGFCMQKFQKRIRADFV